MKATSNKSNGFLRFIKWFWMLFLTGFLLLFLVFLLASWGVFGKLPTFEILENPQTNLATEFISSDGETLGKIYLEDNRTDIPFDTIPKHVVDALIATEDARFHDHAGIDARGTLRAFAYLGKKGGASTISQQLAKQLFTGEGSKNLMERLTQKIKEWVIATRLERQLY